MIDFEINTAGGLRHCHQCNTKIIKGTTFLCRYNGDNWGTYENYCVRCAVKTLKGSIQSQIKMLNFFNKLSKWDQ
jgi:hypothetical protein